ncbi:ArsR/SmtB family transcription factor [Rhodococcus pyridinivorans]|uniref:ArsR/SmtB family transcription factor n=1 Tax=Rhodococcus pyridinivorans TaxID=103816 RepID=UPI00207873D5|nr:metalloregulator ArsR/SmtB family transcription factor [Rhodococcus pyridinivorans]USI93094.1 metalloregulator ArsR/SmtB family transcription factor [Rhodococcus pyridinivorans]
MEIPAQDAFDALVDPTRRAILELLAAHEELTVNEIAAGIDNVGRTAISSHLRILRKSGLIIERREGRFRHLSLHADGPVLEAVAFLQGILTTGLLPKGQPVVSPEEAQPDNDAVGLGTSKAHNRSPERSGHGQRTYG